jgi:hypothetical protein
VITSWRGHSFPGCTLSDREAVIGEGRLRIAIDSGQNIL